jgi:hypothetical protein
MIITLKFKAQEFKKMKSLSYRFIMSSWNFVSMKKQSVPNYLRVVRNFNLFFSTDYLKTGCFKIGETKIQTNDIALVSFFFDISSFVPHIGGNWVDSTKYKTKPLNSFAEICKKRVIDVKNEDVEQDKRDERDYGEYTHDDLYELDESDSLYTPHAEFDDHINFKWMKKYEGYGCHSEISWTNLTILMKDKCLGDRKITDFCDVFIYGSSTTPPGICPNPSCNLIHSIYLTKFQFYLDNSKVKSFDCMYSPYCSFSMCLFRHHADKFLIQTDINSPIKSPHIRQLAASIHLLEKNQK